MNMYEILRHSSQYDTIVDPGFPVLDSDDLFSVGDGDVSYDPEETEDYFFLPVTTTCYFDDWEETTMVSSDQEWEQIIEEQLLPEPVKYPITIRSIQNIIFKDNACCTCYNNSIVFQFNNGIPLKTTCTLRDIYGSDFSQYLSWRFDEGKLIISMHHPPPILKTFYRLLVLSDGFEWQSPMMVLFSHSSCCQYFEKMPLMFENGLPVNINRNISYIVKQWGLKIKSVEVKRDDFGCIIHLQITKKIGKHSHKARKTVFSAKKVTCNNPHISLEISSMTKTSIKLSLSGDITKRTGNDIGAIVINGVNLTFTF